jgi:phosphate transport system substrate-binding protein
MSRRLRVCLHCFFLSSLFFPPFLTACSPQPVSVTQEPATLRLVAADSCGSLVEALAAAYEESRPWVTIHVEVFNSSVSEQTLRAGEADLAFLSWVQQTVDVDPLWLEPFARDGIAIIAHPSVPLREMGLAFLQEIFRGRIQEWEGSVLTVVSREEGSGTRAAFNRVVLDIHRATHTAIVASSGEAVVEHVRQRPGAIGYVSTLHITQPVAESVRVLPLEGVMPTRAAVSDGSYPLSRRLLMAAMTEPTGEARQFAQWVLGPQGQAIAGWFGEPVERIDLSSE